MKIIIATDSFKGSQSSISAANCIEAGIRRVFPEAQIKKIPIADGGEGTVQAMIDAAGGELITHTVKNPLGREITASYGLLKSGEAVIETAAASGLTLLNENQRNPLLTGTYGTGQLILAALQKGCKKIIVGLGGSATNDGGAGMAQALGVSLKDGNGNEIESGGGNLSKLSSVDLQGLNPLISDTEIILASDVLSPLCGPDGATAIFGRQKGASDEMLVILEQALIHYAKTVAKYTGYDYSRTPGSGAAGGLGYGLMSFCGAKIKSGIEAVMDAIDMDSLLKDSDLVITGEGRIDGQTAMGKAPVGIARRAKRFGIPVLAIAGSIGDGAEAVYPHGIDSIFSSVSRPMTLSEAISNSAFDITDATERAMRILALGISLYRK